MRPKKLLILLLDAVELYIPLAAFCILFATFIWSVITRYIWGKPCSWATDVELGCYIWMVLLSASYVMRKDKHVRFTIIYDLVGPRMQVVMRLISNLLIIFPFACLLLPTCRYLANLNTISTALRLPLRYYYAAIVWFIVSVALYALRDFWRDLKLLFSRQTDPEVKPTNSQKEDFA